MNLYELSNEYRVLYDALDEAESDEEIDDLIRQCEAIENDIQDRLLNLAKVCKLLGREAANIKHEKDRLARLQKSAERKLASLKQYILYVMQMNGCTKLSGIMASVSIRNCPESVQVYDLATALQSGYIKSITPDESWLDKAEIKRAMQSGEVVPGCELVRNTTLTIK